MSKKKINLNLKIWFYMTIFSSLILLFLWFFQVIFFKSYYENIKTKELKETVSSIKNNYTDDYQKLDSISHDSGICLEVIENSMVVYSSTAFNRGCMMDNPSLNNYRRKFIISGLKEDLYSLTNPRFNNKTLISAFKINNKYFFASVSLEPLDSAINILKSQLVYITFIVLIFSFIVAYFISKKISKPVLEINNKTMSLATGKYDTKFDYKTDIKEIYELESSLNYMKEELSKIEELRMELLSNVSHDLKTPLTMIKAYAEMVKDLTYNDEVKRNQNLDTIILETERLNLLVNDILTLSVTNANIDNINYEKIELNKFINDILKRYEIFIEQEGYEFIFNCDKKVFIKADKKQLEQVTYNLINNAINYTGLDNKVTINVVSVNDIVRVEIIDTGKGINKKDILYIWDRYYHSNKKHKRNLVGTGLGLSIVRNILENHKFKYGVISKKNKGTTFYFETKKVD